MMSGVATLVQKIVAPFLAGLCLAGAASADGALAMVALVAGGAVSVFTSLPVGSQMIRQITGAG